MRRLFFWRRFNRKQKRYWELAVGAILVVLIPLAVATLRQPDKTEAAWYNDQWLYRKAIPITSAATQTNTQIKVLSNYDLSALVTAGKLQSDLDDIRFTDINGRILKYWIDDATAASADIWVFVPSIPSSGATIYMYYGNPSAGAGKSTVGTADYPGISCKAIKLSGVSTSGLYYIDPTGQETSDKYQIYCEMTSNGGGWTTLIVNPAENTTYDPFVDFGSVGVPGNGFYSVWSKRTQITYTEMLLKPSYEPLMWATLTTTSPGFFRWTDASGNESTRQAVYATSIGVGRTNSYSTGCSGFSPTGAYGMVMYEQPQTWCTPNGAEVGFGLFSGDPRGCHRDGMKWSWGTTPGGNEVCPSQGQWKSGYSLVGIRETTVAISQTPVIGTLASEEQSVGPVGYWKFDEGKGAVANNSSWQKGSSITNILTNPSFETGATTDWSSVNGTMTVTNDGIVGTKAVSLNAGYMYSPGSCSGLSVSNGESLTARVYYKGTAGVQLQIHQCGGAIQVPVNFAASTTWQVATVSWTNSTGSTQNNMLILINTLGASVTVDGAQLERSSSVKPYCDGSLLGHGSRSWSGTAHASTSTCDTGNDGDINGSTWTMEDQCISGKCLKFDGSNDVVNVPTSTSFDFGTGNYTLSAWVKGTGTDNYRAIVYRYSTTGFALLTDITTGTIRTWANDVVVNGTTNVLDNKWHYLTVTRSGATLTVYVDGKSENSSGSAGSANATYSGNPLKIGLHQDGSSYPFKGFIDEVKVYPYARSAAQVKADFAQGSAGLGGKQGSSAALGAKTQEYLSEGLVGYWKMDETAANSCSGGANDSCDSSGSGLDGAWSGGATFTPGKYGNGTTYDGTEDYITTASSPLGSITSTSKFTLSTWVRVSSLPSALKRFVTNQVITNEFEVSLEINSSNQLGASIGKAGVGSQDINSDTAMSANTWYHLVGVFDGSNLIIYVDGDRKNSVAYNATTTGASANNRGWALGAERYGASSPDTTYYNFAGVLDDVRVYNRTLSPKEIRDLYNWAPGPMRYWDFEDGSGGSVTDKSGNANTGTWSGTGSKHWDAGKYGKAATFNGTDDMITAPNFGNNAPTTEITISFWARVNESRTTSLFLLNPDDGTNRINFHPCYSNGNTYWDFGNISTTGRLSFSSPANCLIGWHHYSLVNSVQGNYMAVYQDGIRIGYKTGAGTFTNTAADLRIGYMAGYSYFLGSVDDIKIYNYARSAKQIVEDMNASHPSVGSPVGSAVGYWKFDEGADNKCSGGTNDACNSGSGGSALDGAATSTTWAQSGKYGKALSFGGSAKVNIGDPSGGQLDPGTGSFSTSFWVKANSFGANNYVYEKGYYVVGVNGYGSKFSSSNGTLYFYASQGTSPQDIATATGFVTGQWYYVTEVYDRTAAKIRIYVNGILKDEQATSIAASTDISNSSSFYLGQYQGSSMGLDGVLDEFKFYNYALTADEIKTDYNRGTGLVLGSLSNTSGVTGGSVASNSASAEYCIPGDTSTCSAPVGRWDFEEGSGGTVYDTSGNGKNGTYNGSSTTRFASGKVGKAGVFNSANTDYVDLGVQSSLTPTNITLEAWVKANSLSSWNGIISNMPSWGTGFSLQIGSVQKIAAMVSGTYLNSTTVPTTNTWYHIVATHDGSSNLNILYINGREENRSTQAVSYSASARTEIGVFYTAPSLPFDGLIDQVRIYDYVRTPAQVAWGYNKGKPVGHWKFDECQGGSANDSSGNSNTGTITIGASGTQTSAGTCTGSANTAWKDGATGKRNASLDFDGTDDYVSVGDLAPLDITSNITLSAWIKTNSNTTNQGIMSKYNSGTNQRAYSFLLNTSGKLRVLLSDDGTGTTITDLAGNTTLSTGTWYHAAITYNGATVRLYLNGVEDKNTARTAGINNSSEGFRIGSHDTGTYFNGQIDDVRVFNYALTPSQIKDIMNDGAIRFGPSTGAP